MAVNIEGYVSVEDAATFLGISRATVYNMIRSSEINSVKILNHRLLPQDELAAILRPKTLEATA